MGKGEWVKGRDSALGWLVSRLVLSGEPCGPLGRSFRWIPEWLVTEVTKGKSHLSLLSLSRPGAGLNWPHCDPNKTQNPQLRILSFVSFDLCSARWPNSQSSIYGCDFVTFAAETGLRFAAACGYV
jgi:hypothetical protein